MLQWLFSFYWTFLKQNKGSVIKLKGKIRILLKKDFINHFSVEKKRRVFGDN